MKRRIVAALQRTNRFEFVIDTAGEAEVIRNLAAVAQKAAKKSG